MPTKGEYVKFKTYEKKIKSPFIIHADFESILVPDNGRQNPEESYKNKYQKHICSQYQYVLMIRLVSLSKHTKVKMLFTILLIVSSKKINIAKNVNCEKKKKFNKELVNN